MAAGLLVFLLVLPAPPLRAAVARVELAPLTGSIFSAPAPLSYFSPATAPIFVPGLTAAPMLDAPPSGPAAMTEAAASAAPLPARAAAVDPLPAGPSTAEAAQDRARTAVENTEKTAVALDERTGRSGGDLLARDYAVYERADLQRAADAVAAGTKSKYRREVAAAVFSRNRELREKLIARVVKEDKPGVWSGLLAEIYFCLRAAYFSDHDPGVRAAVSSRYHDSAAFFLDHIAGDPALPAAARDLARGISARYFTEDRLLAALAWGRREKNRLADGRESFAAEAAALPALAAKMERSDVGTRSEDRPWQAPGLDAGVPAKAGTGVWRRTSDLNQRSRDFKDQYARFQLSRERWNASRRIPLSARAAAREKARWIRAASSFDRALSNHENIVDYTLNATLKQNFAHLDGGVRGRLLHPPHPSVILQETGEGYLLPQAVFETKIQDPAVVAAFRRSIEGYWTRVFEENGRRRRLTTLTDVRVLAPEQNYTPGSLRLVDGGIQSSAGTDVINLRREFRFHVPAHEFGHILGLPDEYVNTYSPESMIVVDEQDRSSLMANHEGLLQTRHILQIVEAMRQAGRLQQLTPQ